MPSLTLERIRELDEELPLGAPEVVLALVEGALVAVADEERRLPVQAIAEQRRPREVTAPARHLDEIQRWIAPRAHVLADDAQEDSRVEVVRGLQALDLGREQPRASHERAGRGGAAVDV